MVVQNSTISLIRLWTLCVRSQDDGDEDFAVRWATLRKMLETQHAGMPELLRARSVDDLLQEHFQEGYSSGFVNFAHYWKGMEAILIACDRFTTGGFKDRSVDEKVESLRRFRDWVLAELRSNEPFREGPMLPLENVASMCETLAAARDATQAVSDYWDNILLGLRTQLAENRELWITSDDIAQALLTWLEQLLDLDSESEDEDQRTPSSTNSEVRFDGIEPGGWPRQPSHPQRAFGDQNAPGTVSAPVHSDTRVQAEVPFSTPSLHRSFSGPCPVPWLLDNELSGERPEVRRCREQLRRRLADNGQELTLARLYRAIRDTLETPAVMASGGSERRSKAAVRAGSSRLMDVVLRRIREAFRDLERGGPPGYRAAVLEAQRTQSRSADPCPDSILQDLLRSQTASAILLERRLACVPHMYRLAWLVSQAELRCQGQALDVWRQGRHGDVSRRTSGSRSALVKGSSPRLGVSAEVPTSPWRQATGTEAVHRTRLAGRHHS